MENCPYCDSKIEINHDDGYGYEEDEIHNQQCKCCGKRFVYTTTIVRYYALEHADCLNDGEHCFEQVIGSPKEFYTGHKRCSVCGEEKIDQNANQEAIKKYFDNLERPVPENAKSTI